MQAQRSFKFILLLFAVFLLSASCKQKTATERNQPISGEILSVSYAIGFAISYHDDYKEVIVYNPWEKGAVYARYYLVSGQDTETPQNGIKIVVPLPTIAITAVTQIEFLSLLDEFNTITGICSPEYVYNAAIRGKIEGKEISDLGDSFNLNVEKALMLHPSALMTSGYNQNDPHVARVDKAGIPVIYNNEWMETSLLARAEWIKFVSTFYNKEPQADSIFNVVEQNYNELKKLAHGASTKPNILSGSNFRGTWYMPGGRSYMGQLFADANGTYFYANDTTSGSLPLNVETVIHNFSNADVWLNCSFDSMEELLKADSKHTLFKPVASNEVYNFNKRTLPSGANDFWESAVAHPDQLLADVIAILHPSLLPEHQLVYAEKLK